MASGKLVLHRRIALEDVSVEKTDRASFALQIMSPQKSFIICAHDELEMGEWEKDLQHFIKKCVEKSGGRKTKQAAPLWVQDKDKNECELCDQRCLCCAKCSSHKMLLKHIDERQEVLVDEKFVFVTVASRCVDVVTYAVSFAKEDISSFVNPTRRPLLRYCM
eukprot:jgi/Bigna1/125968/aug1.1_g676